MPNDSILYPGRSSKENLWLIASIYFVVTAVCAFPLWNHAHHPSDDGLILAYSWRILNGQLPYRDFFYQWPPVTPYLHQIWFLLPRNLVFLSARAGYFAEMALTAWIWRYWAFKQGWKLSAGANVFCLIFFLYSLHCFPPMPWPTVDGVFFGTLGAVLYLFALQALKRNKIVLHIGAACCFVLSAGTKQGFAALPLLYICFAFWHMRKNFRLLLAVVALFGISMALLARTALLESSIQEWVQGTCQGALIEYGFSRYLGTQTLVLLPAFAIGFISRTRSAYRPYFLALLILIFGACTWRAFRYNYLEQGYVLLLIAIGLMAADLVQTYRQERHASKILAAYYAFAIAIPWTASFSYGWSSPLLGIAGCGPAVARIADALVTSLPRKREAGFALATLFALCLALTLHYSIYKPYFDFPRAEQTYNLAGVYPEFGSLFTNKRTFSSYEELRQIHSAIGKTSHPITVFPDFPLFYFLENRKNPMPLDWWVPGHYQDKKKLALELFDRVKPVIILHKQVFDSWYPNDELKSWLLAKTRVSYSSPNFDVLYFK